MAKYMTRLMDVIKQHFGVRALKIEYYGQMFVWVRLSKMCSPQRFGKNTFKFDKSQNMWIL